MVGNGSKYPDGGTTNLVCGIAGLTISFGTLWYCAVAGCGFGGCLMFDDISGGFKFVDAVATFCIEVDC
jgi:hypothetical protein